MACQRPVVTGRTGRPDRGVRVDVEVVCEDCGERNPRHARFCLGCGTPFRVTGDAARKLVTIVFADVVGSTELGERLDPEALRTVMLDAFRRIEAIVDFHGGTVEKFIGDAVMAVFGIPSAHEDDALRAVRAAAEMRTEVAAVDRALVARHGVSLRLRIGVNTGEVMTGGGRQTLVTGDAVNVAARLEQQAGPGEILLGPVTAALVGAAVVGEVLESVVVKGRQAPVVPTRFDDLRDDAGRRPSIGSALVGRHDESARLDDLLAEVVASGQARLVTVVGAPGVGKTRLVEECLARWGDRATALVGTCPPYGRGITYWPLREAIRRRVDGVGAADGEVPDALTAALTEVLGDHPRASEVVADVLGLVGLRPGGDVVDGTSAVRTMLETMARRRPVVVVLDDAQWAEPGLLDLVEHVMRWWSGGPLLAVVLARPELARRHPDWPGVPGSATTLGLEPLGVDDAERLAVALLGDRHDGGSLCQRLVRAAGGNPLFIEELARSAVEVGADPVEAAGVPPRGAAVDPDADRGATAVPDAIRALLAARLDRLGTERRVVLQRGAVIGESFERPSLVALTPADEHRDLSTTLLAVMRDDLLRPRHDGATERYTFRHLLLRDVAYVSLPKRDRGELHATLASFMADQATTHGVEMAELVGYHLEQAADLLDEVGEDRGRVEDLARRAGAALEDAGMRAQARGDVPGAVILLGRAADRLAGHERLPLVLGALGSAMTEAGDLSSARSVLDRAVAEAVRRGDERARTHAVLYSLWLESATSPDGWTARASREANRAIAVGERLGDELGLARAWVMLAEVRWSGCQFALVEEALRRGTRHARAAGDPREEVENVAALTSTAVEGPLPVADGIARCHETLQRHGDNRSVQARTMRSLALLQAMVGDHAALATIEASIDGFRGLGQTYWLAVTTGARGRVRRHLGDDTGAIADLRDAVDRLERLGEQSQRARFAALLGQCLAVAGGAREALEWSRVARGSVDADDLEPQVHWRLAAAQAHLARGDVARARVLATEAVDLATPTDALPMRALAQEVLAVVAAADHDGDAADTARRAAAADRAAKGERDGPLGTGGQFSSGLGAR